MWSLDGEASSERLEQAWQRVWTPVGFRLLAFCAIGAGMFPWEPPPFWAFTCGVRSPLLAQDWLVGDLHYTTSQSHPVLLLEEGSLCPERSAAKCALTDFGRFGWKSKSELLKGSFL